MGKSTINWDLGGVYYGSGFIEYKTICQSVLSEYKSGQNGNTKL